MRNLLLQFSAIICFCLFSDKLSAQQTLQFDASTSFLSIDENSFLAYTEYGNRVLFQELTFTGDVIWEDTLFFENYSDSFAIHDVLFFPGRDSLLILSKASLSQLEYPIYSQNDTLLCQFTLLNLADREFEASFVDTIYTPGKIFLSPFNTDSIYLFHSHRDGVGSAEKYKTLSIDTGLNINVIAPEDSLVNYYGYYSEFYIYDDTIYKYTVIDIAEEINMYDNEVSHFYNDFKTRFTGLYFNSIYAINSFSKDSLFLLKQGTENGIYQKRWLFIWSDLYLTTVKSINIATPQYSQNEYFGITGWYKVVLHESTQDIYILAKALNSIGQEVVRLFIYDNNFNFKCEQNVNNVVYENCQLITLGDKVYLKQNTNDNCYLTMLHSCESLGIQELIPDLDVKLYPNPFVDVLSIDFGQSKKGVLRVLDNIGREVETQIFNSQNLQIDLSKMESSTYWLQFEINNHIVVKKVVKIE